MRFPWQKPPPTAQRLAVHYRPPKATQTYCAAATTMKSADAVGIVAVPAGRLTTDVVRVTCVPCRAAIGKVVR